MKIGLYTDCHWSSYSSIVRSRGNKFSTRLENLIQSINWAESMFENTCDMVICLGDFFDTAQCSAEEITALHELKFANIPHKALVGNHEMGINDLSFSSAHVFNLCPEFETIDKPEYSVVGNVGFLYLPYILEVDRKPLDHYLRDKNDNLNTIILSHNDLKGISMGKFVSTTGFDITEIDNNCRLFINGHLHNGTWVSKKILNLGNLTGQNFSEDASRYAHNIAILDTDTMQVELIENPFALNFYKIESSLNLNDIKSNSVVTIKVSASDVTAIKEKIAGSKNIIESRVLVDIAKESSTVESIEELNSIDHLEQFKGYILENIGSSDMIMEELMEVIS